MEKIKFKLIFLAIIFFAVFGFARSSFAATLYMGPSETYKNLQSAMVAMSSGDTLIIRDGIYTGSPNVLDPSHYPPNGTSGAWTTIKAEHDGAVTFDGQNQINMANYTPSSLTLTNRYVKFQGIIWSRSTDNCFTSRDNAYVKFINCGFFDAGDNGPTPLFISESSYILVEGCYFYGSGRYHTCSYKSDHVIYRNCVGRLDYVYSPDEPLGGFALYSNNYSLVQNCISIDNDSTPYVSDYYNGPFVVPTTVGESNYVKFENSIGLKSRTGGITIAAQSYAYNTVFKNVVVWDAYHAENPSTMIFSLWGRGDLIDHCTFGTGNQNAGDAGWVINCYGGINDTVRNSVIYGYSGTGGLYYQVPTVDYNDAYNPGLSGSNYSTTPGAHMKSSNPIADGSLKYLPRIESGSPLDGAASDSGDIGANLDYLIGTPETLYGESGYDTKTTTPMWPFPNEALIKTKMAAYSNHSVNGARGFAASGNGLYGGPKTLTSYIWEYLGNACPHTNPADPCYYGGAYSGGADTTPPRAPTGLRVQ